MKKYLCVVQYVGKNYCGFQKQNNGNSIQQEIEKAIETATKQKSEIFASGRTDAGVNAIAQTFHFESNTTIPADKLPFAINQFLPNDIKILSAKQVEQDFHARFSVKNKTYQYRAYVSQVELPLKNEQSFWLKKQPDIKKMKSAAKLLVGEHNFKAFMSAGGQAKTFVRKIFSIKISQKKEDIFFEIKGNGFLYNMVRIIVGTLLEVGYEKKTKSDVKQILESQDRKNAGFLTPSYALFLKEVEY